MSLVASHGGAEQGGSLYIITINDKNTAKVAAHLTTIDVLSKFDT